MNEIIIRALEGELENAEADMRMAYTRVGYLASWRDGANTDYMNPRGAVEKAIRWLELARDRYDNTQAELKKARGESEL